MAKVLVIDDDVAVVKTVSSVLQAHGHEVSEASNGNEGLAMYRQEGFDLVITDIIMPEKEGFATIEEMKKEFPDVRIVAISGTSHEGVGSYLELAQELGADDVLHKPFMVDDLVGTVNRVIQ